MVCQHLPRSCRLKNSRESKDLQPCPGNNGKAERKDYICCSKKAITSGEVLKVKLSGDVTKICRKVNLINFTFTLLNEKATTMSPKGNHTLAIINGTEDYDLLKISLSDLVEEVKCLSSIMIKGVTFPIEFYLGGDLKFLAIICGIQSATVT